MRRLLLLLGALAMHDSLYAQTSEPAPTRNSVYVELLGNGGVYSLNYDRLLSERTSVRVGVARWSVSDSWGGRTAVTSLPVMANYLHGAGNRKLELGAGLLAGHRGEGSVHAGVRPGSSFLTLTGTIGYRFQRAEGGRFFRIGFTPFYGLTGGESAYPQRGLLPSVGARISRFPQPPAP